MGFLEDTTPLVDPIGGDPLSLSAGKDQTDYIVDLNNAVEDIRSSVAFHNVKAFTAVPTTVLDSADALTNWTGTGVTPSLDTVNKTTGTGSVKLFMRSDSITNKGYVNTPGLPSTSGKFRIAFDMRWAIHGQMNLMPHEAWEFFIASGINMTGTVVAIAPPYMAQNNFLSLSLPLTGLTTLGSFGMRHRGLPYKTTHTNVGIDVWFDNVRFEATEYDVALASQNSIMVPLDYVSSTPQTLYAMPAGKSVLDLRVVSPGVFNKSVRYGAEFGIFPGTSTNITPRLAFAIGQIPPGGTLKLDPGQYVHDGTVEMWKLHGGMDLDFTGCTFYRTLLNQGVGGFSFRDTQRVHMHGFKMFGLRIDTALGSAMTSVASNRLSPQSSDNEDPSPDAPLPLWAGIAGTGTGVDAKVGKSPGGVSFQLWNNAISGVGATIGMTSPVGALAAYDVEGSTSYDVSAYFRGHIEPQVYMPALPRTCQLTIHWYTAAGTPVLPDSTFTGVEVDVSTWAPVIGSLVSPPTAQKAAMEVDILNCMGGDTTFNNAAAAVLSTSLTTSSLSFSVVSVPGSWPTGPHTLHMEGEKLLIDSRVGTLFTVNAAGRGYQGTTAAAHAPPAQAQQVAGESHIVDLIGLQRTTPRALSVVGTTITLTNPGDEARVATSRVYARDKDLFSKCDFLLSDTAHIEGDCELLARDDETGELLGSKIISTATTGAPLTSTPTTYQLAYQTAGWVDTFNDLARLVRFSVRKKFLGINTITITSTTEYGRNNYISDNGENGIGVSDTDPASTDLLLEDIWVEGYGMEAITLTSGSGRCTCRRVVSRSCIRQGFALTGGFDNMYEDWVVIGCGRSGMDIEPPTSGRIVRRGVLRNGKVFRPKNAGVANGPWTSCRYMTIDGLYIWKQGSGSNVGGLWSTVRGVISAEPTTGIGGGADLTFTGYNSTFSDCVVEWGWVLESVPTRTWIDDNGNNVLVGDFNVATNIRIRTPGGAGAIIHGNNFATPAMARGSLVATAGQTQFVVACPQQADTNYQVQAELDWAGSYRILPGRTTTSFTIETVEAPIGGGNIRWATLGV